MSGVWNYPSHRDPDTPQVEFCDLCGAPIGAADRILGIAEGLTMKWLCPEHWELALSLSFTDLGGTGQVIPPKIPTLPHSGDNAFEDP